MTTPSNYRCNLPALLKGGEGARDHFEKRGPPDSKLNTGKIKLYMLTQFEPLNLKGKFMLHQLAIETTVGILFRTLH